MRITQNGDKFGLFDEKNNALIPCEYQRLSPIIVKLGKRSVDAYDAIGKKELVCAQKNDLFGVFDLDGAPVLPFEYEAIGRYAIGDFFTVRKGGKWGIISRSGESVLPFAYDALGHFFAGEGIIAKKGDFYGIIRRDGSEIVPFIYDFLQYEEPADGYLKYPHWLLYEAVYQGRTYTFGYNYLPIDLSIYGATTQRSAKFTSSSRCEYYLSVSTSIFPCGKVVLKSDGEEWEEQSPNRYQPLQPENSYQHALADLLTRLEQGAAVDAAYLKTTFGKVYTWSYIFWDKIRPFLREDNHAYIFDCVVEIMLLGLQQPASKEDGAAGRRNFYEQGLRLIHAHTSAEQYEVYCNYMLNALKEKNPAKHAFLLDCFF